METYFAIDPNFDLKAFFLLRLRQPKTEILKENGVASITIKGVLGNGPYFDTTYSAILENLEDCLEDKSISKVKLLINSPGGQLSGLSNILQKIRDLREKKEVESVINGTAGSAAHAIAAQANNIFAESPMDVVGSLGVIVSQYVDENLVTITSDQAPKKAYDLGTEEGKADMRAFLTKMHSLLIEEVVKGYAGKVSEEKINDLKGQVMPAKEALEKGFINGIINNNSVTDKKNNIDLNGNNSNNNIKTEILNKGFKKMEISELKEKHPELVGQIKKEVLADYQKNTVQARTVLTSTEYPQPIKELAAKVISGECGNDALVATIATFDSMKESKAEKKAIDETEKIGETAPKVVDANADISAEYKTNGEIKGSKDFQTEYDKIKNLI